MERIATLRSDSGAAEVYFHHGVFTLGADEQVTPRELLAWSDERRLRWERDGLAEWVAAYAAEAPLAPAASTHSRRSIVLAAVAAAIVLLAFGVVGTSFGRQVLTQDRARREGALTAAKREADQAERKSMMLGEEIQRVADGGTPSGNVTVGVVKPEQPAVQPASQPQQFSQYCRIKAWYTSGGFSSETAYVHFKTVDAQGKTVKQVLGSDEMNIRKEQKALAETARRRQLVNSLRRTMTSAGWTEIGVADGGEWYEYVFGRGD